MVEDDIVGVVLDADDSRPIAAAHVFVRSGDVFLPFSAAAFTDAEGKFRLRTNPAASESIVCRAPGHLQALVTPTIGVDEPLTIRMSRGSSIRGRVIDDQGMPVQGARVWAFIEGNPAAWPHGSEWLLASDLGQGGTATSDTSGAFEITGLDPEQPLRVRAARTSYTSIAEEDIVTTPGAGSEVVVKLVPVVDLIVTVVDEETGSMVRHAVLNVTTPAGTAMRRPTNYSTLTGETARQSKDRTSFRFLRFAASAVADALVARVSASAHGYHSKSVEIPVSLGGSHHFELRLARESGVVFGRVQLRAEWEGGKPFTGGLGVLFWSPSVRGGQGADAVFENGESDESIALPVGTYVTSTAGIGPSGRWWKDYGPEGSCVVTAPRGDQISRCRVILRGAILRVRVQSADGAPVRGYGLAVVSKDGMGGLHPLWHQEYIASRIGSTFLEYADILVPAGRHTCYAKMQDGRQASAEVLAGSTGDLMETVIVID